MVALPNNVCLWLVLWAALAQLITPRVARAAGPTAAGRTVAILIGVRDYNRLRNLKWSDKDVVLVKETLQRSCGCEPRDIVLMTHTSEEKYKPTGGNIRAVLLDQELRDADEAGVDRVLLYFAGHGLKDAEGRLYLAPQDYVVGQPKETGVSIKLVRDTLQKCSRIRTKFLILDTCYAASTRGEPTSLSEAIASELQGTQGVFTLASCQPDEESLEWNEMRQGVFTYWFCRGLEGAADLCPHGNGDGKVDTDELEKYVTANVVKTTEQLGHVQTPVAIRSKELKGSPVLADLSGTADQRQTAIRAWGHVEQSLKYRNGSNFSDALAELERAFQSRPSQEELRELYALRGRFQVERGKTHANDGAFQAALGDLDQAIKRHHSPGPRSELASFYTWRGEANYQLKRYEDALVDATEVLKLLPSSAQAFRNRAEVHRRLGNEAAAEKDEANAACAPAGDPLPEATSTNAVEAPSEPRPTVAP